ncbi:Hypothetical Protein FCC1311_002102 [Hondaea fermentalgiana]|uniref:Thioredoxin domain-containing protein n=1 Tax=Hondaea fermentalgiana TaxID=2315210 RepID=A0A2R5FZ18_9STRA|nr:Hypothetical Protein FCC1311_002102 [Hondaea fermentalgiana]|eukprot:GBG23992.1 Hypothetical Protein FCC1311_002102 [Hondaea fermentalgiana]
MRECDLATWMSESKSVSMEEASPLDAATRQANLEIVCLVERSDPVCAFATTHLRKTQKELQIKVTIVEVESFQDTISNPYGVHAFPATLLLCDGRPIKVLRSGYRESLALIGPVSSENLVDFVRDARDKLIDAEDPLALAPVPVSF